MRFSCLENRRTRGDRFRRQAGYKNTRRYRRQRATVPVHDIRSHRQPPPQTAGRRNEHAPERGDHALSCPDHIASMFARRRAGFSLHVRRRACTSMYL
ncbi:hypothetical protein BD626DRAFT_482712, partial [Schizophyllum amplum]